MVIRGLRWMVLLAMAPLAVAEERFYPIMGPDGQMQLIRSVEPAPAEKAPVPDAAAAGDRRDGAAPAAAPAAEPEPEPSALAPYDSGSYADVEDVDRELARGEERKRFYLINDGMGARISESGEDAGAGLPEVAPQPSAVPPPVGAYKELANRYEEFAAEGALRAFPALATCLGPERRGEARELAAGEPLGVVLNRQAYQFLDGSGAAEVIRVAEDGLRTVVLRSYSRTTRDPSFPEPALVLLGEDGCVTRLVMGYFDRFYPATDASHPALRAEVLLHADDRYLLVMAMPEQSPDDPIRPFRLSRFGQMKLTLKK